MKRLICVWLVTIAFNCHAIMDAWGWEYGSPVRLADGHFDSPKFIEGPFLQLFRFSKLEPIHPDGKASYYRASYQGQAVFLKAHYKGTSATVIARHNQQTELARLLDSKGVGPRFLGTTFIPSGTDVQSGHFAIVHEFHEGQVYSPLANHLGYTKPRLRLPRGIKATPQMLDDVNTTFDRLNELGIEAEDAQFLLTPDGRAWLIDFEEFELRTPDEARIFNEPIRSLILAGLEHNLKRSCGQAILQDKQ